MALTLAPLHCDHWSKTPSCLQTRPLARSDEYLVTKRMDWHHRSMFSPLLVAVLQSFVVFPSSLSLFPFFTRQVSRSP